MRVDFDGIWLHSFQGIEYGRQFLVFHLDEFHRFLGNIWVLSRDHGNYVPQMTNLIFAQARLVLNKIAIEIVREIFCRNNSRYPGEVLGLAHVNLSYPSMMVFAQEALGMQHTREHKIVHISEASRDEILPIYPGDPFANET
jgi:hypothetical protein